MIALSNITLGISTVRIGNVLAYEWCRSGYKTWRKPSMLIYLYQGGRMGFLQIIQVTPPHPTTWRTKTGVINTTFISLLTLSQAHCLKILLDVNNLLTFFGLLYCSYLLLNAYMNNLIPRHSTLETTYVWWPKTTKCDWFLQTVGDQFIYRT